MCPTQIRCVNTSLYADLTISVILLFDDVLTKWKTAGVPGESPSRTKALGRGEGREGPSACPPERTEKETPGERPRVRLPQGQQPKVMCKPQDLHRKEGAARADTSARGPAPALGDVSAQQSRIRARTKASRTLSPPQTEPPAKFWLQTVQLETADPSRPPWFSFCKADCLHVLSHTIFKFLLKHYQELGRRPAPP